MDGLWCMWRESVTCCAQTCADFWCSIFFGGAIFSKKRDENEGADVDFGPLSFTVSGSWEKEQPMSHKEDRRLL